MCAPITLPTALQAFSKLLTLMSQGWNLVGEYLQPLAGRFYRSYFEAAAQETAGDRAVPDVKPATVNRPKQLPEPVQVHIYVHLRMSEATPLGLKFSRTCVIACPAHPASSAKLCVGCLALKFMRFSVSAHEVMKLHYPDRVCVEIVSCSCPKHSTCCLSNGNQKTVCIANRR